MTASGLVILLQRVAAKDKAAFSDLYAATSAKLYGTVLRILIRRDLADEVLQEVYVKIWERAGDFDPTRASPITWMVTIARNRALDIVRKAQPMSLEDQPAGFDVASDAPLALDVLLESEDGRRLNECLQRLDPEKREIVVLAYLNGVSREELGRRFDTPMPNHQNLAAA